MKPPVEHVRVSTKGKEILIKVKRRTGLEHWNEICRIALCRSLANPTQPPKIEKIGDISIDIDWKTFAGASSDFLATVTYLRASNDKIDYHNKELMIDYFRGHLERGINSLQHTCTIKDLVE
ncbi:MAG TPA: DNA sulfur modification protein DndE [Bellilinea sp.]|mgnify:CR=1 FL=1|nr:DNA sulfur modification protein DndE [Bellilinea sp.]